MSYHLMLKSDELILEFSGGELVVVTENARQKQLRQQLMEFVLENEGVPVKVGIQGRINSMNNQIIEGLYELVLVNYNNIEAKATNNFFKMLNTRPLAKVID